MCVHHLQRQGHWKEMRTTSPVLSTEGDHIQPRKGREKTPERRAGSPRRKRLRLDLMGGATGVGCASFPLSFS